VADPRIGIGLRGPHLQELLRGPGRVGILEVHTENYLGGGPARRALERLRRDHAVSLHGVGLSLGGAGPIHSPHLRRICKLADEIEPSLISEHLSWSGSDGIYLNDLLPLPYTEESLAVLASHVTEVQEALRRPIALENPARVLRYRTSAMSEGEFLAELVRATGCLLLCDVNNLHVSATNLEYDARRELEALPAASVAEIHLAGHHVTELDGRPLLIDDHGSRIPAPVWDLYDEALAFFGTVPTIVEWDANLPPLAVLLGEAETALDHMNGVRRAAAWVR